MGQGRREDRWCGAGGSGGRGEEKRHREAPSPVAPSTEPRGPSEELARTVHASIPRGPVGRGAALAELPFSAASMETGGWEK